MTAHADRGLPTIYRTHPSADLAQRVVEALLPQGDAVLAAADVAAAYGKSGGNMRETLFTLFDVYQERQAANAE